MGLRSMFYRLGRIMGDARAVRKGPKAVVKRQVRKAAYRTTGRLLRKLLK